VPSVYLTTLGCPKNQVDSEKVESMLDQAGYRFCSTPGDADVVMVNTCAFVEEARRESVETILELEDVKRTDARMVVIGCLAQRFGADLVEALPEVDAVVGLDRYGELVAILDQLTGWTPVGTPRRRPVMDILHATGRPRPEVPYAYVKVAEGCDKGCTFCAIPLIRGRQRSRPLEEIVREAEGLAEGGVSEIVLVAQDLAAYGADLGRRRIVDLVSKVAAVDGVRRVRLLYLYPREITEPLVEGIASNPRVASYFDLSLQHASLRLLRAMRRPGSGERFLQLIDRIRRADPDACLRSSFIVGFPGEDEEDVETLAEFLEEARLDWAGFFPYSAEPGTPAAELGGRPGPSEVADRLTYLTGIQERITWERSADTVGRVLDVLVDEIDDGVPVGRSYREAPEIDGVVMLDRGNPGDWVRARIVSAYGAETEGKVEE
jgi:ribosomal protein S12 methylthiotransferase